MSCMWFILGWRLVGGHADHLVMVMITKVCGTLLVVRVQCLSRVWSYAAHLFGHCAASQQASPMPARGSHWHVVRHRHWQHS
jgi:hypothetical protein